MVKRAVVAFAIVALLAVGVLGGLTWIQTQSEVSSLVKSRQAAAAHDITLALADAYAAAGSWQSADLRAARVLAISDGATLLVRDAAGATVTGAFGPGTGMGGFGAMMHSGVGGTLGDPQQVPVMSGGHHVGTAVLRFALATPAAEQQVRSALGHTVIWGGALAVAIASLIGLFVARRIVRPLRRLTTAARALAAGDRSARGGGDEPAELGDLGRAFDGMAETIEREDELRRAFAADVAHELRTPLAIAQGELEALVDGIAEPTPDRMQSLHEEMLRLGRIVADVETLAAAEAAKFRLELQTIDLAEVASEAVGALRGQADAGGLQLTTRLEPAPVEADRARLGQIARNLLGNALKFTPPGGTVLVSVDVANGDARLIVEDTGPGIADEDIPHLFERFWRGRSTRDADGSGVGLAVVSELVHAHGGRVEASARPGGGARFVVSLPHA